MNLTLSLIIGLLWLLPGLVGLIFWNVTSRRSGVRNPDQPLTAIGGLVLVLGIALAAHLVGVLVAHIAFAAMGDWGVAGPASPYRDVVAIMTRPTSGPNAAPLGVGEAWVLVEFALVLMLLCALSASVVRSPGLPIYFLGTDVHAQGWAYQHIGVPHFHDFVPVAFVLTNQTEEGVGLAYAGTIADIRMDDHGEVKAIALAEPERLLYWLENGDPPTGGTPWEFLNRLPATAPAGKPEFTLDEEADLEGEVLYIGASQIRNILVDSFRKEHVEAINQAPDPPGAGASGQAGGIAALIAPSPPAEAQANAATDSGDEPG